jgi:hypothetical protein
MKKLIYMENFSNATPMIENSYNNNAGALVHQQIIPTGRLLLVGGVSTNFSG